MTYSLSGEGSEHFEVSDDGQITLSGNLNHETTPSYTLILSVSDGKDGIGNPDSNGPVTDASITVNITVEDVDEPPGSVDPVMVTTLSSSELLARWSIAPN